MLGTKVIDFDDQKFFFLLKGARSVRHSLQLILFVNILNFEPQLNVFEPKIEPNLCLSKRTVPRKRSLVCSNFLHLGVMHKVDVY